MLISLAIGLCIIFERSNTPRIPMTKNVLLIIASTIVITGSFIRWWAIWCLGNFFQTVVGIQDGQRILKKGPYRFVRHPAYSGAMLVFIGFGFGLGTWFGLAIMLMPFIEYYHRIQLEERLMISRFQDEYLLLIKETKKLIPFIY